MTPNQTATNDQPVTVGRFTYNPATSSLLGPKAFMESADYRQWRARFAAGRDTCYNFAVGGVQPGLAVQFEPITGRGSDPVVAMLVSLQTCFAGWHGLQTLGPRS